MKIDGIRQEAPEVTDVLATLGDDKRIWFWFTIPCRVEATDKAREVRVSQYDPEYWYPTQFSTIDHVVVDAGPFSQKVVRFTNDAEAYYGGMVSPEELVLRFCSTSIEPDPEALFAANESLADSGGAGGAGAAPRKAVRTGLMVWLAMKQSLIQQQMQKLIQAQKVSGSVTPSFLLLCLMAFSYGALHAAGPGHGKVVTTSYLLGEGRRWWAGLALGVMVSLFYGLSGIAVVLIGRYIVETTLPLAGMGKSEKVLKIVSYAMIAAIGAFLVFSESRNWFKKQHAAKAAGGETGAVASAMNGRNYLAIGLAAGIVPCPASRS